MKEYPKRPTKLLFNCDMGEGYGSWNMSADAQLMPLVNQANIACGGHASDPDTMDATVLLAIENNVAIGAHPGYPDKAGFGRRAFPLKGAALVNELLCQIGALDAICRKHNAKLSHVKAHGALYNKMMREHSTLQCVLEAVAAFDPSLPVVVQAGDQSDNDRLCEIAEPAGVGLMFEAFADRAYMAAQQLASRDTAGSILDNPAKIVQQARTLCSGKPLLSVHGKPLRIVADTLCFHGDNPASLAALELLQSNR